MSLDPRLRARAASVPVRPSVVVQATNDELAASYFQTLKLADATCESYHSHVRNAIRYFQTPEGAEIPVSKWTKAEVWAYVHFAERSFCANFRQLTFARPLRAGCDLKVWEGYKPAEEAARDNCAECPLFRGSRDGVRKRLQALSNWFSHLANYDVIPFNFIPDILKKWRQETHLEEETGERKRNPTMQEMARLVNETPHPARRAFVACSAKWGCRPNEMLRLDRYASFGLALPEGVEPSRGFAASFRLGFPQNPQTRSFEQGGQVVYLPERYNDQGEKLPDKRKGNRWLVVDAELRPILEQYLAWWDRNVKRDPLTGCPLTTALWLQDDGAPETLNDKGAPRGGFNERWFYRDAERLGLMLEGDREDPLRRWAGHCQRHFFEQVCEMREVPSDWCNHFRGDKFKDSRNRYFLPKPEQVQEKYLRWIPTYGFKALPGAPRVRGGVTARSETQTHRSILQQEILKLRSIKSGYAWLTMARLHVEGEEAAWVVPQRVAGSVRYALRVALPNRAVRVVPSGAERSGCNAEELAQRLERALAFLGQEEGREATRASAAA